MDKSTGSKPQKIGSSSFLRNTLYRRGCIKERFCNTPDPERAFKGLGVAKRYCSMDSIGNGFPHGLETGIRQVCNLATTKFFQVHPANPPPSRFDAGELPAPEQAPDRGFGKP